MRKESEYNLKKVKIVSKADDLSTRIYLNDMDISNQVTEIMWESRAGKIPHVTLKFALVDIEIDGIVVEEK